MLDKPKAISRPSWDEYFLELLGALKLRASCPRRSCSAIVVDKDNNLISTGYNGPPTGIPNCLENPCDGVNDESGNTSRCMALHAEHNAIYFCNNRSAAHTMYCTHLPCFKCALEICQTPISRVVYLDGYSDERSIKLFEMKGISLVKGELRNEK